MKKIRSIAFGRVACSLLLGLVITLLSFTGMGCDNPKNSGTAATTKGVTLLVFVDRSGSIVGYPNGSLDGIRRDYERIAQRYVKGVLKHFDNVKVEVHGFVKDDIVLFKKKVNKWEEIRTPLKAELAKDPYKEGEASRTLFVNLLNTLHAICTNKENADRDIYVLVLTDGHPDDAYPAAKAFKAIKKSATDFAADYPHNLKYILIAPVEPDMTVDWRGKLNDALAPLDSTIDVVNSTDYQNAVDAALKTLGGEK